MAKKEKQSLANVFAGLRDTLKAAAPKAARHIPSILEFVELPEYLGLPMNFNINLFPMQRLMLKAFYRGTEGNEHLTFEPEELEYLKACGLDDPDKGSVIQKLNNGTLFKELVLVWGRGSGKDFIVSLIALYEAMLLLETPGGDPYAKYGLMRGGNPITILTVATAAPQAMLAFNEIKGKLMQSRYFQGKFRPEGIGAQSISLLTPQDLIDNEERLKHGLKPDKGGLLILSGHSNSDSLLGKQVIVLLLDEVASFKQTDGASGGRRTYEALLPCMNRFVRSVPKVDDKGQPTFNKKGEVEVQRVVDFKVISISSPRGKEGVLWEKFNHADERPDCLACRLPTWVVNTRWTRESLRKEYSQFNDESFMMEFGAEFSVSGGTSFFVEAHILDCIDYARPFRNSGLPGIVYFAHLDPATTNNNYALVIVHKELFISQLTRRAEYNVVLDHLKVWSPRFDGKKVYPVMLDHVEKYLLQMNRLFHIGLTTYDTFNSMGTLASLRKIGMPSKMTHFGKPYKMEIYTELEKLINEKRLVMPYDELLKNELINLQRRWDSGRGFSVLPNKESDCNTDDCCDALAGAVYNCLATTQSQLPQAKLANVPLVSSGGAKQWNSMQGVPYSQQQFGHVQRFLRGGSQGPNITAM